MTTPAIIDDDDGTISAETPMRVVRTWSYADREEQHLKMLMAREFKEGWYQAEKVHRIPQRGLSEFEGM